MGLSLLGLAIALAALIYFTYKGGSPLLLAPVCAAVIALFSGLNVTSAITTDFAAGFATMIKNVGLLFIGSTLFGNVMAKSGGSQAIAEFIASRMNVEKCTWAIIITSAVMSYAGMSFGAYIIIYPIGLILCERSNYNKGILMGATLAGSWTFAMTGPWAPTVGNILPTQYLGTTTDCGLIPGLAGSIFMFIACGIYCEWQVKNWRAHGRVCQHHDEIGIQMTVLPKEELPSIIQAIVPVIVCIILFNVVHLNIYISMFIATLVAIGVMYKRFSPRKWFGVASEGARNGCIPMGNLAIMGGFAAVVSQTPIYTILTNFFMNSSLNPYFLSALAGTVFAFFLGSSSSSISVIMTTISKVFLSYGERGYDMGNVHRLLAMGSGGPDSLPHCGSIVTMNYLFNTTHKESYWPVFITCTIIPIIATFCIALPLAMLGLH